MVLGLIITLGVGVLCLIFGLLIWKKQKISLIHSYHYTHVSEENKKAYTAMMGKGITILGIGILLYGIFTFALQIPFGWLFLLFGFIIGFGTTIRAQVKFNGGM